MTCRASAEHAEVTVTEGESQDQIFEERARVVIKEAAVGVESRAQQGLEFGAVNACGARRVLTWADSAVPSR